MTRQTKRVRSTGAVETPSAPVEHTMTPGRPESTDAVEHSHAEPVETRASHLGETVTVRQDAPEPFTASVGWLSEAESKVIVQTGEPAGPKASRAKAETKGSNDGADAASDH